MAISSIGKVMSAAAVATTLMWLFGHFCGVRTVFLKDTRWGKFTQLMANHIFCYKNRNESFAIMNIEGVPYEVRSDRAAARPSFNWLFSAGFVHLVNFIEEFPLDIGAFFKGACHD